MKDAVVIDEIRHDQNSSDGAEIKELAAEIKAKMSLKDILLAVEEGMDLADMAEAAYLLHLYHCGIAPDLDRVDRLSKVLDAAVATTRQSQLFIVIGTSGVRCVEGEGEVACRGLARIPSNGARR